MISERALKETMDSYEKTIKHVWQMGYSQGYSEGKEKVASDLIEDLRKRYPEKKDEGVVVDSATASISLFDANDKAYRE